MFQSDNGIRHVTLHKTNDNQTFDFFKIISSHNKAGATVGKTPLHEHFLRTDVDRDDSQPTGKMNMHKVWIGQSTDLFFLLMHAIA
jgi:hypothetical protein